MLLARGGLDREAEPSHDGVMVCKVDTGGDQRRYEIRANVTLVVEDADDNAPYPQAEERHERERRVVWKLNSSTKINHNQKIRH